MKLRDQATNAQNMPTEIRSEVPKGQARAGHPWQKSVNEPLRFTSNGAEFTAATWTTGYRRNASSARRTGTTQAGTKCDALKRRYYKCAQWFLTSMVSQTS
jgi:hypothetical protein